MKFSFVQAAQWVGAGLVILVLVGLNFEYKSDAGLKLNAPVEDSLSQGMRGYWKLDDGTGTNATDSSGNSNTLAMTGSPSWATGNIGPYALDFSGTGQYLSVTDPSSGVLDFYGYYQSFTLTGWFNRDSSGRRDTMVAKRNSDTSSDAGYLLWISTTNYLNFEISDGTAGGSNEYSVASSGTYATTGWHHFAAVWQGNKGMFLYVDGALSNSTTTSTSSIDDFGNGVAFRIGAESSSGTENPFDGKIDDVRVYGYALSADEVAKLAQITAPAQPIDTGLVGHWTFDGADIHGTTAIDRSGKGNDGMITEAMPAIGKLGQGLRFDGDEDYVSISDPGTGSVLDFGNGSSITLSLWTYPTTFYATIYPTFISKAGNYYLSHNSYCSTACDILFEYFETDGSTYHDYKTNTGVLKLNQWQHIVVTYIFGTGSSIKVYVDGSLQTGSWTMRTGNAEPYQGDYEVLLGCLDNEGSMTNEITGKMDDIRIYNRVLSSTEILNLYTLGR